ncbi:MAG: hypothetical protein KatS3mg038_1377 [Candidatus Kapaibacterium sp.]|nr:MAG: hypothetical protein KatS3mg038_1377 [Candidatus Kapabacteria bacterium]
MDGDAIGCAAERYLERCVGHTEPAEDLRNGAFHPMSDLLTFCRESLAERAKLAAEYSDGIAKVCKLTVEVFDKFKFAGKSLTCFDCTGDAAVALFQPGKLCKPLPNLERAFR